MDIATVWDTINGRGDWNLDFAAAPTAEQDLATAVLISLFTDRAAEHDDAIPDASDDPRGWWGDLGADRPIGSKLWLRMREKQLPTVLALVKNDIVEALQWLIDDGVATEVDVVTEFPRPGMIGSTVTITRGDGQKLSLRFDWAWQQGVS